MAVRLVTKNIIREIVNDIATAHYQIHSFGYGDVDEYVNKTMNEETQLVAGNTIYPRLFLSPQESSIVGKRIKRGYQVIIADLVRKGDMNRTEVESDTEQILMDVIAQLQLQDYGFLLDTTNIVITPFDERFSDEVTGHFATVSLDTGYEYNRCQIPTSFISVSNPYIPIDEEGTNERDPLSWHLAGQSLDYSAVLGTTNDQEWRVIHDGVTIATIQATGLKLNVLNALDTPAGSFLVNDGGIVKTRTAVQVRTDIGAGTGAGSVTSVGLAAGTSGNDVSISGSPVTGSGTITINIPSASASARGLVTIGAQTFGGAKRFASISTGGPALGAYEVTINGDAYSVGGFKVGTDDTLVGTIRGIRGELNELQITSNLEDIRIGSVNFPTAIFIGSSNGTRVAIGTAGTGQYQLEVAGDVFASAGLRVSTGRVYTNAGYLGLESTINTDIRIGSAAFPNAIYIGGSSGKVAINQAAAAYELDVNGMVQATRYILAPNGTNTIWNLVNATNTFAGIYSLQAGGGSPGFGGSVSMYGHSHASRPGWIIAGISAASGGKFAVNNQAAGGGTSVFLVDILGNTNVIGNLVVGSTAAATARVDVLGALNSVAMNIKTSTSASYVQYREVAGVRQAGYFGSTPIAKPTITGAKGGNAALTSLITQLALCGFITDSTT